MNIPLHKFVPFHAVDDHLRLGGRDDDAKPYDAQDDFAKNGLIRDRMAAGGPPWEPKT